MSVDQKTAHVLTIVCNNYNNCFFFYLRPQCSMFGRVLVHEDMTNFK